MASRIDPRCEPTVDNEHLEGYAVFISPGGSLDHRFHKSSRYLVQVRDSTTPAAEAASAQLSIVVYLAPATQVPSPNWSGYVLANGPYTGVQATFDIPQIYANSTNTDTAEWVGIDGWGNTSLIQAGIDEPYDASTNTYQVVAWWTLSTYNFIGQPISMVVSPGDSVTVVIGQISGTNWGITVTDNTTGQSFTTDQAYAGPLASAEWIVEAPTLNGAVETLGAYTPDVTFTGLGITGPAAVLYDVSMVQGGVQVSTPSTLDSTGFNVAYGDLAPPPP